MLSTVSSLSQMLRDAMARHGREGRTALWGRSGPISYEQLTVRIDAYAGAHRDLALGEPVGILASRSAESIALFFGIMQAGGCPSFLEPGLDADAIRSRMDTGGMRRVLVEGEAEALATDLRDQETDVRRLADLGLTAAPSKSPGRHSPPLTATSPAMQLFTSGSTGPPKRVQLTHGNLMCHATGIIARTTLTPTDRLLHVMPLHHTNGVNNQLIAPLIAGASIALVERFQADAIEDQIGEYRATYMTGVPTMYSRTLPHLHDRDARRSLRFLRCGSAPITVGLHRQIEEAFGVPLVVSYGLSEATCTSTMNPPGARRLGSVGTALPDQDVRLFKAATLEPVPPGEEGEVCISGPCVMSSSVEPLSEQSVRDGWLRTGDLGRFDADDYLFITGRIKDVIIRGGENLSPLLIEDAVSRHPAVRFCCVVGGPHPDLGEVPVAFVVLRDGQTLHPADLVPFVAQRLPRIYRPDIRLVATLPETSMGKIDRRAVRDTLLTD
ncbi:MAG: class I adenylate-forming enzyme family protein [bacterium]